MKKILGIQLLLVLLVGGLCACVQRSQQDPLPEEPLQEQEESGDGQDWREEERPPVGMAFHNNKLKNEDEITLVQLMEPAEGDAAAVIQTNLGEITVRLFPQYAPMAVENFSALANENFYNGKLFYFANRESVIQSGAVNSNGTGSRSALTDENGDELHFEVETDWDLWHFSGAVSLVPDSEGKNGSQFMITTAPRIYANDEEELEAAGYPQKVIAAYEERGGIPFHDGYNTVFGMVVDGMDTAHEIAGLETDGSGAPKTPVVIESITIGVFGEEIPLPARQEPQEAAA